jgi:hypothetical protein
MFRPVCHTLIVGGLLCALGDRTALAGPWFHHHHEGTPPPGCPRAIGHTWARAGYPPCVSTHAHPTYTPEYIGYFVGGGGSAHHGCPRRPEDGTWGRDYEGMFLLRHVGLKWNHGRCYQGGTGAYDPDGPFVPDVIGLTVSKIHNH